MAANVIIDTHSNRQGRI